MTMTPMILRSRARLSAWLNDLHREILRTKEASLSNAEQIAILKAILNDILTSSSKAVQNTDSLKDSVAEVIAYEAESALEQAHDTHIFPSSTDDDLVLTAGGAANTWGTWAQLMDTGGNIFRFPRNLHISAVTFEEASVNDDIYAIELSRDSPQEDDHPDQVLLWRNSEASADSPAKDPVGYGLGQ